MYFITFVMEIIMKELSSQQVETVSGAGLITDGINNLLDKPARDIGNAIGNIAGNAAGQVLNGAKNVISGVVGGVVSTVGNIFGGLLGGR